MNGIVLPSRTSADTVTSVSTRGAEGVAVFGSGQVQPRRGDVARRDEDGYFFIVDRIKDLIIRGGFNVYPREVEETLMSHPAVSMVAVIGVPDAALGRRSRRSWY